LRVVFPRFLRVRCCGGWVYEIKTDGYRAQVHIRDKRVTIYSRSGYDWTDEFAPIAKAASKLKVRQAIIDGEATVLGNTGLPDFQALRRELRNSQSNRLIYHASICFTSMAMTCDELHSWSANTP
jgi:bifunctional non-homologous end joining protein LigD